MGLQLAISLTDEAREVLSGLSTPEQRDYASLIDALTRRFSPDGRESQYSLELMNRTCKTDEDVTSYGHAVRRLAAKAYPGQGLDGQILVDLYIKGLRNVDMKRNVYLSKPANLSEAINCAVTYEAFDKPLSVVTDEAADKLRKPKPSVIAPVQVRQTQDTHAVSDNSKKDCTVTNKLLETMEKMNSSIVDLKREVSHMGKQSDNRQRGNSHMTSRNNVECYNCHEMGHYSRECPKPKQGFSKNPRAGDGKYDRALDRQSNVALN